MMTIVLCAKVIYLFFIILIHCLSELNTFEIMFQKK